ncbi:STAS domain-containing protein [Streptomyces sp. Go40/10]|uniref:STAS domain-containing protein n=1 Tax=Streptomyces sp. Go40/10 TaxID=2825844 RepID=UPI001E580678|nr:STAS domain-containing protein [Streptomyces sp. Go40/10]UFR06175.1 STAS domain-containing protein [Streptomyces sp. Go40/10]
MFSVQVGPMARACVFTLRGELDHESAVQLREAADQVLSEASPPALVVVDCTGLTFCDSSGISFLIRIHQRLSAQGGVLRLAAVPSSVARVFALTGLDQAIGVHDTLHHAVSAGCTVREPASEDRPSLRAANGG